MNRNLRALIPVLILGTASTSLMADTTGRLAGHISNKAGQSVAEASITLSRTDRTWTKQATANSKGAWRIIGLDPVEYVVTIEAKGYATYKYKQKCPLGDTGNRDVVLLTLTESGGRTLIDDSGTEGSGSIDGKEGSSDDKGDPGQKEDAEARAAFNAAIPLYNGKQYAEALPNLEKAYKEMTSAVADMKDAGAKAESQSLLPTIGRAYGTALHQVGKDDEAIPPLTSIVDANPKDAKNADLVKTLVDIYTAKKDDVNRAKYQAMLNAITGTSGAAEPYNHAVNAFNASKFKEAKQYLLKAIAADSSFPDSYYLMGVVEINQGNMASAKANFKKYLELAPSGKHAGEIKEMGF